MMSPSTFFNTKLELLVWSLTGDTYVLGDFNLDAKRDYAYKNEILNLNNFALTSNLSQIVNFDTWSQIVNGVKRSSVLDHIYVKDRSTTLNVSIFVLKMHNRCESLFWVDYRWMKGLGADGIYFGVCLLLISTSFW